jgi:hypothetical protein
MSETCRVLYQIHLRNSASRWLSLLEYITMRGPLNVKFITSVVHTTFYAGGLWSNAPNAEVKNVWSFTYAPSICIHGMDGKNNLFLWSRVF